MVFPPEIGMFVRKTGKSFTNVTYGRYNPPLKKIFLPTNIPISGHNWCGSYS